MKRVIWISCVSILALSVVIGGGIGLALLWDLLDEESPDFVLPMKIDGYTYYFSMSDCYAGDEPHVFRCSLARFLSEHPDLQIKEIKPEKTHPIGINGYYVTFEKK